MTQFQNITHDLKKTYLFSALDEEELEKVASLVETETYSPGDALFSTGQEPNSLYVIHYGSVKTELSVTAGSEDLSFGILGNGSILGEVSLLSHSPRATTAKVIEDAKIFRIRFTSLQNLLEKNQKMALAVYAALGKHLGQMFQRSLAQLSLLRERPLHRSL